MNRVDEVWEELSDVGRQFGDDMVFSELFFADFKGFLLGCFFIKVSERVDVFVQEDVEGVRFKQCFISFEDTPEWCFVDDDDI